MMVVYFIHVVGTHFEINDSNKLSYYIDPIESQTKTSRRRVDSNYPWVLSSRIHFEINDPNHADYVIWFTDICKIVLKGHFDEFHSNHMSSWFEST
jgi:hypothetical protein